MLEELHTVPEERRTTEVIVHGAVAAFALFSFLELMTNIGAVAVLAGAGFALGAVAYGSWLHRRWGARPERQGDFRPSEGRLQLS